LGGNDQVETHCRMPNASGNGRFDMKIQWCKDKMAHKQAKMADKIARMEAQRAAWLDKVQARAASGVQAGDVPLARFVSDMSLPDGSVVAGAANVTKVWEVENITRDTWPQGLRVVPVGAQAITAVVATEDVVPAAVPGQRVAITIDLVTPSAPGRYVQYFRLADAKGQRFGHPLWVDLTVEAPRFEAVPVDKAAAAAVSVQPQPVVPPVVPVAVPEVIAAPVAAPEVVVVPEVPAPVPAQAPAAAPAHSHAEVIEVLVKMGFAAAEATIAIEATGGRIGEAVELLLHAAAGN